ncbi:MAG: ABC transporter permease [Desulfuromonadales bacterium]|nr:ABC transporter permease [Desulfuromonadales bacterium]
MLTNLGRILLLSAQSLGEMLSLLVETLFYFKEAFRNRAAIVAQLYEVGVGTLPIAILMSLFIGMVLALQTGSQLALLGVQEKIGTIVGLSMAKELGPVLTSLLIAGRVGSSMAAEVGAMQVYEEIDAMRTLEINPVRYLAMPRLIACLLAVPMLTVFSFLVGVTGGAVVSDINPAINVPMTVYYDVLTRSLDMAEILNGLVKATVFGGIVALVGCYVGFKTTGGARGIGRATTRSVVMSFLMIFVADYFLTRFMM